MNLILFTFFSSLITTRLLQAGVSIQLKNRIIHIDVKGNSTFSSLINISDNTEASKLNLTAKKHINQLKAKIAIKTKVPLLHFLHKFNCRDNSMNKRANLRVSIHL